MSDKQILILAPHIDDELIGCYSVLEANRGKGNLTIAWFYELTVERMTEANALLANYNAKGLWEPSSFKVLDYKEIYLCSFEDAHVHHKELNARFRHLATHFYSVDMNVPKPLAKEAADHKLWLLENFYPSQRKLWEGNGKYYLFENITTRDYRRYKTLHYGYGNHSIKIKIDVEFSEIVKTAMSDIVVEQHSPQNILDRVIKYTGGKTPVSVCYGLDEYVVGQF